MNKRNRGLMTPAGSAYGVKNTVNKPRNIVGPVKIKNAVAMKPKKVGYSLARNTSTCLY